MFLEVIFIIKVVSQPNVLYHYRVFYPRLITKRPRRIGRNGSCKKMDARFKFLMLFLNALICSEAEYVFGVSDERLCLLC